jgi:CubicO group peptidase (beta-lactamase class C family)
MKRILCCLALFGLAARPLSAAPPPDAAFLQGIGSRALATGAAPGIALAVAYKGRIVYEGGFGSANVAANDPVTANTPFAIGSLSKQLTAAAIMLLVRERKLSLSDDLSNYVPSLPGAGRITLRMLLDQNSGLHNYPRLSEHAWPTQGAIPLASLLAILSTDTLDFSPGAKWEYSNSNYAALAAVVERVSGVPFGAFLRTQIFEPLHMTASDFGYAAQQSGAVAIGYVNGKPETPPLSLDLLQRSRRRCLLRARPGAVGSGPHARRPDFPIVLSDGMAGRRTVRPGYSALYNGMGARDACRPPRTLAQRPDTGCRRILLQCNLPR